MLLGLLAVTLPAREPRAAGSAGANAGNVEIELKARTDFAAGRYDQALEIYAELYAKTLHPTYLRNVGRCYQNMKQPDQAISAFREYLRKVETLDEKNRKEIDRYIAEMEALKRSREEAPARAVAAPPPASPVSLSRVNLAAPPPADKTDQSATEPVLVDKAPPPETTSAPLYARWWFWTALGVVAAGAVVTTIALSSPGPQAPGAPTTLGTKDGK